MYGDHSREVVYGYCGLKVAPCKGIRILESRNFLLVESGIQHQESGILLKIGIRNPTY